MSDRRLSITFSDYLTGGVPDGTPLWREGRRREPERTRTAAPPDRADARVDDEERPS